MLPNRTARGEFDPIDRPTGIEQLALPYAKCYNKLNRKHYKISSRNQFRKYLHTTTTTPMTRRDAIRADLCVVIIQFPSAYIPTYLPDSYDYKKVKVRPCDTFLIHFPSSSNCSLSLAVSFSAVVVVFDSPSKECLITIRFAVT